MEKACHPTYVSIGNKASKVAMSGVRAWEVCARDLGVDLLPKALLRHFQVLDGRHAYVLCKALAKAQQLSMLKPGVAIAPWLCGRGPWRASAVWCAWRSAAALAPSRTRRAGPCGALHGRRGTRPCCCAPGAGAPAPGKC